MSWKYYCKFIEKMIEAITGTEEILLDVLTIILRDIQFDLISRSCFKKVDKGKN